MFIPRFAVALLLAPVAFAQPPIVEIKVAGAARIPPAAVIAASGLRAGQPVVRLQLDAAVQKIFDTGFYTSANYRYDPKPGGVAGSGYIVTLQVAEEPARMPVVLDIPGQDEEQLWQQLKSADKFVDRQIPDNERAAAYFQHAVEKMLQKSNHPQEMTIKTEADLHTGKVIDVCRPAHLPKVAAMRFEGNHAVSSGALEANLTKVAMGEEYTDREFHRWLELNVRPRYEELGRLTVAFPHLKMELTGDSAVAVTTTIDEGPVWRLGTVSLAGEALPVAAMLDAGHFANGMPANWKQLLLSMQNMEQVLRRDGYISVNSNPARSFRESEHIVDVTINVRKGRQFMFGQVHMEGLDASTIDRLMGAWKLAKGAPMNELYPNEFVKEVMPSVRGKVKSVSTELHPQLATGVADVTIKFRGPS